MTLDPESNAETAPPAESSDLWSRMIADVRSRFPDVSPGVAFCILKLEQNADLRFRDFRAEAELHGLRLSGRSFHSARVALGLEPPAPRRPRLVVTEPAAEPAEEPAPARRAAVRRPAAPRPSVSVDGESPVIAALREFEAKNAGEVERLRAAIHEVLDVIAAALDD